MAPKRYELSEKQWVRIGPLIAGKASDPGRTGTDNRLFVNAVLWVIRSGEPSISASRVGLKRACGSGSLRI
jgi:transposase